MLAQLVRPGGRLARLTDPDKGEVEALRHRGSLWTPDRGPGFYQTQRARNAAPHLVTTGRRGSLPRALAAQGTVMLSFLRPYSALLAEPYYHSWCDPWLSYTMGIRGSRDQHAFLVSCQGSHIHLKQEVKSFIICLWISGVGSRHKCKTEMTVPPRFPPRPSTRACCRSWGASAPGRPMLYWDA